MNYAFHVEIKNAGEVRNCIADIKAHHMTTHVMAALEDYFGGVLWDTMDCDAIYDAVHSGIKASMIE